MFQSNFTDGSAVSSHGTSTGIWHVQKSFTMDQFTSEGGQLLPAFCTFQDWDHFDLQGTGFYYAEANMWAEETQILTKHFLHDIRMKSLTAVSSHPTHDAKS